MWNRPVHVYYDSVLSTNMCTYVALYRTTFLFQAMADMYWHTRGANVLLTVCGSVWSLLMVINPRRACTVRVTVVVSCVCLSVCVCVCPLPLFCHHRLQGAKRAIQMASVLRSHGY